MKRADKKFALIVAGGSGKRIGADIPKQFLTINKMPILMRTIWTFYHYCKKIPIVVSIQSSEQDYWKFLCKKYNFSIPHKIAKGGKTRFASVKNGLDLFKDKGIVAIHDGVRPCINSNFLDYLYCQAKKKGNAIPSISITESVRKIYKKNKNKVVSRDKLKILQTPQLFQLKQIQMAYATEEKAFFYDDATVFEYVMKKKIHLVKGIQENIKITHPKDLKIASHFLKNNI